MLKIILPERFIEALTLIILPLLSNSLIQFTSMEWKTVGPKVLMTKQEIILSLLSVKGYALALRY